MVSIVNSFLLPKFLSIETYAMIKTYTLYIGYAGFLSLGYADGMYLKYGGISFEQIDTKDLGSSYKSFAGFECFIGLVCLVISLYLHNFVLIAFSLGSVCINLIGYYKNLYQAVGEFKLYGKALNYQTMLMLAANLLLLFLFKNDNYHAYIAVQVVSAFVVMVYLTVLMERKKHLFRQGKVAALQIKENISSGFVLMIGNFSSSLFTSLDRWFVKVLMTSTYFAWYSFAASLENIVTVFITPITISLYNSFCKNNDNKFIFRIKQMTLLWGFFVIAAAFPVEFILKYFLKDYYSARNLVYILFAAQAFYAVIKGIHVNLYKAEQKQKRYFVIMLVMTAVAFASNAVFYYFAKTAESLAWATLFTAFLWFLFCEFEKPCIRFHLKEYFFIIIMLGTYFFGTSIGNFIVGCLIYYVVYAVAALTLMRTPTKYLWKELLHRKETT